MISNINDKKQIIKNKNIGILNTNIEILREILEKQNIGKYELLDLNEGIGFLSNFYINEYNKPSSLGKEGLLGFTHLTSSTHPKSIAYEINKKYNIGETISYYSINQSVEKIAEETIDNNFTRFLEHIDSNTTINEYSEKLLGELFNYTYDENNRKKLTGLNHEKFATIYSVLNDILQYDNIKYAMEKTRVGVIEPDPLTSLGGIVITNINSFSGTDTKLGLITNQLYAHALKNGAHFNSLRNTPYITPDVYYNIGNKLSNLSTISSMFRIDDKTGRLIFDIGEGYNQTINLEHENFNNFENRNRVKGDIITHTALYENLISNNGNVLTGNYSPFKQYKLNFFTSFNNDNNGDEKYEEIDITKSYFQSNLLQKTYDSFKKDKNGEIKNGTLISRFHTTKGADDTYNKKTIFQTAVSEQFGLSHGRNLLNKNAFYKNKKDSNGNPYARTWTKYKEYKNLSDTISALRIYESSDTKIVDFSDYQKLIKDGTFSDHFSTNSVLDENGLPRIMPKINNDGEVDNNEIKKTMFSIENLAWKSATASKYLDASQVGPNGGRIMWFPPYNLSFNESVQTNWNPVSFIGRGEKIWTYVDTERSGTLSFTLLIDYPSIINKWIKEENAAEDEKEFELLSFFAGSDTLRILNKIEESEQKALDNINIENSEDAKYGEENIAYVFFDTDQTEFSGYTKTSYELVEIEDKYRIKNLKKIETFKKDTIVSVEEDIKELTSGYYKIIEDEGIDGKYLSKLENIPIVNEIPKTDWEYVIVSVPTNKPLILETNELPKEELKEYAYIIHMGQYYVWQEVEYQLTKPPTGAVFNTNVLPEVELKEYTYIKYNGQYYVWKEMTTGYYTIYNGTPSNSIIEMSYLPTFKIEEYTFIKYDENYYIWKELKGFYEPINISPPNDYVIILETNELPKEELKEYAYIKYNEQYYAWKPGELDENSEKYILVNDELYELIKNEEKYYYTPAISKNKFKIKNLEDIDSFDVGKAIKLEIDIEGYKTGYYKVVKKDDRKVLETIKTEIKDTVPDEIKPEEKNPEYIIVEDKLYKLETNSFMDLGSGDTGTRNTKLEEARKFYSDATVSWGDFINKKIPGELKVVNLYGYSSSEETKLRLPRDRCKHIEDKISDFKDISELKIWKREYDYVKCDTIDKGNPDGYSVIRSRCVKVVFKFKKLEEVTKIEDITPESSAETKENMVTLSYSVITDNSSNTDENNNSNNLKYNTEVYYFNKVHKDLPFLKNKIIDKVKYFIPAFHSISPEGFNERLGFLHQCTRQGHTLSTSNNNSGVISAGNMAFGRPPICVLRIGDFYHTKIIIQSITIDYETPQWDMNPEGIGMQPMFANISLNFTFLGGSDLGAPISRLQNAVSFNYYANQSVYDGRADMGKYESNKPTLTKKPFNPI